MDYLKLLEHSFEMDRERDTSMGRLEYLSINIFDFTTYDSAMDELFARKALEVCIAITDKQTFEYQNDEEGYKWYLIMANMPFFVGKLEWGTSIRGAWWALYGEKVFEVSSCGLYENGEQILEPLKFNKIQWDNFIKAVAAFVMAREATPEKS